jgi:hypothetical protein
MKTQSNIGLCLLLACFTVSLSALNARAFALFGPYEPWMTHSNGFLESFDIGGPKNLGEEYRWNVPTVTYAFDPSFLDSFGSNGVAAVESAIQILNDLPPASQIDPGTYPLDSRGENPAAQAQRLIDVKSETLFLLLQQLGLAQPQRFMFCVHDFSITAETTNVTIVLRNFDPFSFAATNVLNGTLYTNFIVIQPPMGPRAESANVDAVPLDPLNSVYTAVADDWAAISAGSFYTGLTRDDVGGLRYLLETNNYNLEPLLPDVHGAGTNSSNYVNIALRGGVDKITFVPETVDPITGEFFSPVTNQYTDTYITNGVLMQQQLERVTTRPDFIFSAYDGADGVAFVKATGTTNWLNNALPGAGGPGTIRPQVKIAFSKFGFSGAVGTSDSDDAFQVSNRRWASFDASTNPPVIYPTGATAGAGNPWAVGLSLINTDALPLRGGYFVWHLPVSLGTTVRLETSTDLVNWTALTTVTNCGVSLLWEHLYSKPAGFFRAVPQ